MKLLSNLLAIFGLFSSVGCANMTNTEKGVGLGGLLGAGLGTAVGAASGDRQTGAVIGGLLGAGVGGLVGNDVDRADARNAQIQQASAEQAYINAQPSRIYEVIDLVKAGHDEQVIINHIRNNRMTFQLSVEDLNTLKANGVPSRVISEMQTSNVAALPARRQRPLIVREQVVVQEPVIVRDPFFFGPHMHYCAPPMMGMGFRFNRW